MMAKPAVSLRHISMNYISRRTFKSITVHAVSDVSLDINDREIVALVGESGSGKSTLGRIMLQMIKPTHGDVVLWGDLVSAQSTSERKRYWKDVQLIFQDPFSALNPVNSVRKILSRPLVNYRNLSGNDLNDAIRDLLTDVGLSPASRYIDKLPHQLSGGQKQRIVIARALASQPKILVADEPISMLDVSIKAGILQLMDRIRRKYGVAYLYITHDLTSAYHFADRIIVLYRGRKMEEGTAEEIVNNPRHPYTRLLLNSVPNIMGKSPGNLLTNRAQVRSKGCPFADRCPDLKDICTNIFPREFPVTASHKVNCHAVQ